MASFFLDEDESNDRQYYSILNVPQSASPDEIVKAYRKLAQVFHPDKHTEEAKRKHAQESFSKVQEAYEVLSDVQKRQIYDVYGKQGLTAGLEVGDHLRSKEEIRKEWEEFKAKQQRQQQDQSVLQKGSYVCRVDARGLLHGQGMGQGPLFKSVVAQSALEAVVAERNVVSLSGQAAVRPAYRKTPHGLEEVTLGGGNVMFGYKRIISEDDTLDLLGQIGLQSLVSITSTRRLDKITSRHGWINTSWSPQAGVGLQVGCSQNLFGPKTDGSVNLVLGPSTATGVATTISHRSSKYNIQGKLELGALHQISLRTSFFLTDTLFLRMIGRLGTSGIDIELGLAKKWNPQIVGYVGTCVGYPAGVVLKVRATRAGQSLECPIHLSASYQDWKLVAAAYIIPPLLYLAVSKLVVHPLLAWSKSTAEKTKRAQMAEATHAALARAADEQTLIEVVARRKLASELASSSTSHGKGLVIVHAVYGKLNEYRQHQQTRPAPPAAAPPATAAGEGVGGSSSEAGGEAAGPSGMEADGAGSREGSGAGERRGLLRGRGRAPPPPWLEVTLALQYLVVDGGLTLHGRLGKSGLMGFADPAPQESDKQLYIAYWHKGTMYEVVVGDTDEVVLPEAPNSSLATPVTDNNQLQLLQERLDALKASVSGQ